MTINIPDTGKSLRDIVLEAAQHTLTLTHDNQAAAARILGISRPTMARLRKNISVPAIATPAPAEHMAVRTSSSTPIVTLALVK